MYFVRGERGVRRWYSRTLEKVVEEDGEDREGEGR